MWVVTFPRDLYTELDKLLFSTEPYENGCFLLAHAYSTKKRSVMLITDILKPTKDSWNARSRHSLMPSSSFINECAIKANATKSSLIFVHTHPDSTHPPTFSKIDKITNKKMFVNLSEIVFKPLGSLVFSRQGVSGVVFNESRICSVREIKIVGIMLDKNSAVKTDEKSLKTRTEFDRQVRALGTQNQQRIQDMSVTVVGVGGTGSAVAVQIARMGVGHIQLVDMDSVDESNLPRIYGSKKTDIGKRKVDVLRRHIRSFSRSKVTAICNDVTYDAMRETLVESDVIFGCTDNHTSRSRLNEISSRFYIPFIDVGCRIDLDEAGAISQAVARVQLVTPDSACLWCTDTINGRAILQESFTEEEKKKLAKEGYYHAIDKQPSVISLTTLTASMAVNKLLSIVGAFGVQFNTRIQMELKDGFIIRDTPKIKANCVCRKNRGGGFIND